MRALVPVTLLVLLALAPFAGAHEDGDVRPSVSLEVGPLSEPLPPGGDAVDVPATVTVPCRVLGNETDAPSTITFAFERVPSWVRVEAEPMELVAEPALCEGDEYEGVTTLRVAAAAAAPAFSLRTFDVSALLASPHGNASRTVNVPVEAGYHGSLTLMPPDATVTARPQVPVRIPVEVRNAGNGDTRVHFEVKDAPDGWSFPSVQPVTVGRADEDAGEGTAIVHVEAFPPTGGAGPTEATFTLAYTSHYAFDPDLAGPAGEVTLSAAVDNTRESPGPGAGLVALAVAAALGLAGVTARRRR